MAQTASGVTFADAFRVSEFRALWLAELSSICGDQLARVALSVLVFQASGSAALTSLTYGLTYAPSLLGGLLLTGIADRRPRRAVMVSVDLMRAGLIALVAVPGVPFWLICVLVGAVSFLNPVFKSAQLALLPTVLPGELFGTGMAIRNMTVQSGQLFGFLAGGALTAAISPHSVLLLDAVTFVASAVLIRTRLRLRPAAAPSDGARRDVGWWTPIRVGAVVAFADRGRRTLVLLTWLMAFLTVYESLAAPYANDLGAGPAVVGLLLAADPLGAIVAVLVFARWTPAALRPRLIGPMAVLAAAALCVTLARPGLLLTVVLFVVSGGLGTLVVMEAVTLFAAAVPDQHRGQAIGLSHSGLTASIGVSSIIAGVVADRLGPAPTVGWFAVASMAAAVGLWVTWRRAVREQPDRWIPAHAAPQSP